MNNEFLASKPLISPTSSPPFSPLSLQTSLTPYNPPQLRVPLLIPVKVSKVLHSILTLIQYWEIRVLNKLRSILRINIFKPVLNEHLMTILSLKFLQDKNMNKLIIPKSDWEIAKNTDELHKHVGLLSDVMTLIKKIYPHITWLEINPVFNKLKAKALEQYPGAKNHEILEIMKGALEKRLLNGPIN